MHSLSVIVFSVHVARLYRLYIISAQSVQESPKLVQVCWQSSHHFPPSSLSAALPASRYLKLDVAKSQRALLNFVSSKLTQQT